MISLLTACAAQTAPAGPQGWTRAEQLRWYHGNQGSRLIPQAWLNALEAADGQGRFFTPARMQALGFLGPDPDDRTGMPIGFAIDRGPDDAFRRSRLRWFAGQRGGEPWIGLTCAACHTGEVRAGGQRVRIEGGPSMLDFQRFVEQVDAALEATLADPARFSRFAAAALNPGGLPAGARDNRDGEENRAALRQALGELVAWERRVEAANRSGSRYGFARLDAFGHIFNKVALLNGGDQARFAAPASAPVSYPFLWNVTQHDKVQWNGVAPNKKLQLPGGVFDVGGLGRNAGEVIGVFADVAMTAPSPGLKGYPSSVDARNLDAIEHQMERLLPPAWPFAPPDPAQVTRGRDLFAKGCASCHAELGRADLKTPVRAVMTPIWAGEEPVGTDPWMACNAFTYRARTGVLAGTPTGFLPSQGGETFGEIADMRQMLAATVAGSLAGEKRAIVGSLARAFFGLPRTITAESGLVAPETAQKTPEQRLAMCRANATDPLMAYKGRPLTGIWATAPYLHNGSVQSLHELLLPPAARKTRFPVGGREIDIAAVGLLPGLGESVTEFRVTDDAGRPIPGNDNAGHDYGNARLTAPDRAALIAYMKTL